MKMTEGQVLASLCRRSLAHFTKEFWEVIAQGEKLEWNWHIQLMCDEVQTAYERVFRHEPKAYDLVTNVPPGSSKSTVHSVMAPAWAWTRMLNFCFIGASYAYPLALDLSRKTRDIVKSEKYQACFPEVKIREDQDTKGYFMNKKGGFRYAVGSNGTIVGFHGNVICVDDPLDPNRAVSEAELFQINEWIKNTLLQRKRDSRISFVDLVMQRLHQDDPSAQMIQNTKVRHLCIPANLEFPVKPKELKKYYVNGLMDPVRFPQEVLDEKRQTNALGEYGFAGQYGQTPVPAGGGKFKTDRLRWGPTPHRWKRIVRFWDKAATVGRKRAAFTVGVKMGEDMDGRVWVLNVKRGQWDSSERERIIKRTALADSRGVVVGVEQEPGSGGKDSALATVKRLKGWRVSVLPARGSKELRADEFSVQVNEGNCWLPESFRADGSWVGWAKALVDELMHWPFSTWKDQGDAAGGAFTILARGKIRVGPIPRKYPGKRRKAMDRTYTGI